MFGLCRAHRVAGGEHQMGLAQAGAAVQQQRVVRAVAGLLRGLPGGGAAELVAAAFDEVVEACSASRDCRAKASPAARSRAARGGSATARARRCAPQRADFQADTSRWPAKCAEQFADARQVALPHLFARRRRWARTAPWPSSRWLGLQRLEPGVDVLGRQFGFQAFEAAGPGIHRWQRSVRQRAARGVGRRARLWISGSTADYHAAARHGDPRAANAAAGCRSSAAPLTSSLVDRDGSARYTFAGLSAANRPSAAMATKRTYQPSNLKRKRDQASVPA